MEFRKNTAPSKPIQRIFQNAQCGRIWYALFKQGSAGDASGDRPWHVLSFVARQILTLQPNSNALRKKQRDATI